MEWVFDKMQDDEYYPDVKVPYFGTFGVNYKKLRNKILAKIRRYKRGKEERQKVVEFVQKYRPLYRRLIEYKVGLRRYYKFDGKKLKRKHPLYHQAAHYPWAWPELDIPQVATKGVFKGLEGEELQAMIKKLGEEKRRKREEKKNKKK